MNKFTSNIDFISSYPPWVRMAVIVWIIISAILIIILIATPRTKQNNPTHEQKESKTEKIDYPNANCQSIDDIFSKHKGKDFFVSSKEHKEFGFRVYGDFDKLLHIEILFNYTDGLHYVSEGELENIFYPLINFGERIEITNYIREDKLGIRLKCHYLNAEDKIEISTLTKEVIKKAFYEFAKIPKDSNLEAEIYNKTRHPDSGWKF